MKTVTVKVVKMEYLERAIFQTTPQSHSKFPSSALNFFIIKCSFPQRLDSYCS